MIQQSKQLFRKKQAIQKLKMQKDSLIQMIMEQYNKQQQEWSSPVSTYEYKPEPAKVIPFSLFSPFLISSKNKPLEQHYIIFKISQQTLRNKESIWASTNMDIVNDQDLFTPVKNSPIKSSIQYSPLNLQESLKDQSMNVFQYAMQLKSNLQQCEHVFDCLKEMKELDMLDKEQRTHIRYTPKKNPYQRRIQQLQKQNKELESELVKLTVTNKKLREKISSMGQAEKSYISSIRDLEQKNASVIHSPQTNKSEDEKKSKHSKVYLINYE